MLRLILKPCIDPETFVKVVLVPLDRPLCAPLDIRLVLGLKNLCCPSSFHLADQGLYYNIQSRVSLASDQHDGDMRLITGLPRSNRWDALAMSICITMYCIMDNRRKAVYSSPLLVSSSLRVANVRSKWAMFSYTTNVTQVPGNTRTKFVPKPR